MRRIGRPPSEEHQIEAFPCPAIGIRRLRKALGRGGERVARQWGAPGQDVARRHAAQVGEQSKQVGIADVQRLDVGDRKRESRAHQEIAGRADVHQWMEPCGRPIRLRRAPRRAQPPQAVAPDKGCEKQPVGAEQPPDERKRPRQIADLIQHARADHEIEGRIGEGQAIFVPLYALRGRRESKPGIDPRDPGAGWRRERAVETPAVQDVREVPFHGIQPIGDPIEHGGSQKVVVRKQRRGAVTAQAPCGAVEYVGPVHGRACAPMRRQRQADMVRWSEPIHAIVRLALPPRCAGCGVPVGDDHRFCASCWGSLRFLGPPWCAGCNRPFAYDRGDDARCAACLADPPRHAGVRAAVAYGDVARLLALRLKYGGRTALAETMARQMVRVLPEDAELLVPVPLHRWRIWSRGFNQAALIAHAVARRARVDHDPFALHRVKRTPMLRGLGGKARARAVSGAFRVPDRSRVAGRAVVLVDDVHTSGATADACVRALRAAGARSVTILCWARVLDDTQTD